LGKIIDWPKIILINFSPIKYSSCFVFASPSFLLSRDSSGAPGVFCKCFYNHAHCLRLEKLDSGREKKAIGALSSCPCVMSPFLSLSETPVSLPDWRLHLKTRYGRPAVVSVTRHTAMWMWRSLRYTPHPPTPTRLPCSQ
jgi:hypothetical protein